MRAAAVRQLGAEETEALEAIAREDADPSVRRLALKKLGNPEVLLDLASSEADESLRQLAQQRANGLLASAAMSDDEGVAHPAVVRLSDDKALVSVAKAGALQSVRMAALERLSDDKAVVEVARGADQVAVRREAVRRLQDPGLLRGLALSEDKEVGLAALEQLEGVDADALEAVAKRAKHKAVRRRAREMHRRAAPTAAPVDEMKRRQQALVRQVEALGSQLAKGGRWGQLAEQLQEARRAMAELRSEPGEAFDAELAAEFAAGCEALEAEQARREAEAAARARRAEEVQHKLELRLALCEELEGLSPEEASTERLEQLRARWAELPEVDNRAVVEMQRRFDRGLKQWARAARASEQPAEAAAAPATERESEDGTAQLEALCGRAEETLARFKRLDAKKIDHVRRQREELESHWKSASRDGVEAEQLQQLQQRFSEAMQALEARLSEADTRRAERAKKNEQRLQDTISRVQELHRTDDLRLAERALKDAGNVFKQSGPLPSKERERELKDQLQEARQQLRAHVAELREAEDWKRWANVPRREELCQEAEEALKIEDREAVVKKLKTLQAKWKKIGPVPHEKSDELWERFKGACDKLREHCAEYFEQLEQQRAKNLEQKERLCEQVEELAESTDWEQTADKIKALQAQWKEIGPVPRKQSDAVWKRFRNACDTFFDRRKKLHLKQLERQRKDNLKLKQQLCEQVEALAESTEWKETADKIKALQAQWKEIGPVPRKQSDAVWKRFRGACDRFFDAREAHFEGQRREYLESKEAVCVELEQLVSEPSSAEGIDLPKALSEARDRFRDIPPGPRSKEEAIRQRFRDACHAVALEHAEAFKGTELDPVANQKRMELICQEVEALVAAAPEPGGEQADPNSVEEMASRLREALVENTFRETGAGDSVGEAVRTAKSLQDQLRRLGPVPPQAKRELAERFKRAYDRVMERQAPRSAQR